MIEQSFTLKKDIFERRKLTTLQHKLRVVLKCYTVRDFILNEDGTFTFKISRRINGKRIDLSKEYQGSFIAEDLNENEVSIKIIV